MVVGALGSSREMEPPPGFASTLMHPPMPRGLPLLAAPNGAPPPFSRPRARRQSTAPSAARFPATASVPYQPTGAPAPPPPGLECGLLEDMSAPVRGLLLSRGRFYTTPS
jgi:hypothetical protein